jgi:hypothetical protein
MKLQEIFDHTEQLVWQRNGRFELSQFKINDGIFNVQIDRKSLDHRFKELIGKRTAEVSFYRADIDDDKKAFSTNSGTTKSSTAKVYGAVLNGLSDKFNEYDAFFFLANRDHSNSDEEYNTKREIYSFMADRMNKKLGFYFYENNESKSTNYLISKIKLSDETKNKTDYKHALSEALKATGLGKGFY